MRVLIGHIIDMPELLERRPIPGRETSADEYLVFGNSYTHINYASGMTWRETLEACPQGWRPDVYIHVSPEYNTIPEGIDEADCLTVAVFGDWNLGGIAVRNVADAFDVLIADKTGGTKLRNAGFPVVRYAPIWGQNPERHRIITETEAGYSAERSIDVLLLGNMNHSIQWERAPYLARVARLSRKYNVKITCGAFGEEYTRTMNNAKIVFNRSIRGELNMRAFEAPACGALMFFEDTNPEVHDVFTDRENCVLYNTDNLESLIDYYLAPENRDERERIAAAGWRQVQDHSYAHHFRMLIEQIEPLVVQFNNNPELRTERPFRRGSQRTRRIRMAHHWLNACNNRNLGRINAILELEQRQCRAQITAVPEQYDRALPVDRAILGPKLSEASASAAYDEAELANLRAVCVAAAAAFISAPEDKNACLSEAVAQCQKAINFDRSHIMSLVNLGYINLALGRSREARTILAKAATMLDSPVFEPAQLRGAHFPRRFDFVDVALERVWIDHEPNSLQWGLGVRNALACRVQITLSEMAFADARYSEACEHAERAHRYLPSHPEPLCALGSAHRAIGNHEAAIEALSTALKANPFLYVTREELARLSLDIGKSDLALDLLNDWAAITAGCPFYEPVAAPFTRLLSEATDAALRNNNTAIPEVTRILAIPNWETESSWQEVIGAFVATYRAEDPVQLMMRIEPEEYPDPRAILGRIREYLTVMLGVSPASAPNVALINQALSQDNRWKLFHAADAIVVDSTDLVPLKYRDLAHASGKPLIRAKDMAIQIRTYATAA